MRERRRWAHGAGAPRFQVGSRGRPRPYDCSVAQTMAPMAKIALRWHVRPCQKQPPMAAKSQNRPPVAILSGCPEFYRALYLRIAKNDLRWHWKRRHRRSFLVSIFAIGARIWLSAATGGRFWQRAGCHRRSILAWRGMPPGTFTSIGRMFRHRSKKTPPGARAERPSLRPGAWSR